MRLVPLTVGAQYSIKYFTGRTIVGSRMGPCRPSSTGKTTVVEETGSPNAGQITEIAANSLRSFDLLY